jgi:hypothetical protein
VRWVRQEVAAVGSSYLAGSGVRRKQRLTNLADADVANYTISVADGVDRTDGASGLSTCIVSQLSKLVIPGVMAGLAAPSSIQKNSAFMLVLLTEFLDLLHACWVLQVI